MSSHSFIRIDFGPTMENEFKPGKLSLLTILISSMMILMGGAAVAPALPDIGQAFPDFDGIFINLIITMPSLAIVVSGLAMGVLADRIGKVKVLVMSLAIFGVSGLSGFFLEDLMLILVGRFGVGVGIAGIVCCTTALIAEYYAGIERKKVLGYQAAAMGIGGLVLELAGGVLADFGWHYPFLIYGIGLLMVFSALVSLKEPTHSGGAEIDVSAFQVPKNAGAIRAFCYAAAFFIMLFMFTFPSKLPEYMEANLGSSPAITGLMLGVLGTSSAVVSMSHKAISGMLDEMTILTSGFVCVGVSGLFFLLDPSYATVAPSAVFMGLGLGLVTPSVLTMLAETSTPATSGKIMGGYSTFINLGQFLSTFVIAAFIGVYGGLTDSVFFTIISMAFVVAVLSLFVKLKLSRM